MCCNIPSFGMTCPEPHDKRVWRDVKEFTERTGFDFERFVDYMFKNQGYVIQVWPDMLDVKGRQFNCALHNHRHDRWAYIINTKTKEVHRILYDKVDRASAEWLIQCGAKEREKEKDEWREKLRSVGIDPEW